MKTYKIEYQYYNNPIDAEDTDFIQAKSIVEAAQKAQAAINTFGWRVVSVEEVTT